MKKRKKKRRKKQKYKEESNPEDEAEKTNLPVKAANHQRPANNQRQHQSSNHQRGEKASIEPEAGRSFEF